MAKINSIDLNTLMSVIRLVKEQLPTYALNYGIMNIDIDVLPPYSRDLSKYKKPSIIVQRVDTHNSLIGRTGYIGQQNDNGTLSDIYGKMISSDYQIDVVADNNTQCMQLTSIVADEILGNVLTRTHNLYDYSQSLTSPVLYGTFAIDRDIDIIPIVTDSDIIIVKHDNNDYVNAIRFDVNVVQVIKPIQEYVDLSKWIKVKQTIHIGGMLDG